MSDVNIPLLRKGVEWVEAQAALDWSEGREWYQGLWVTPRNQVPQLQDDPEACGTAYCLAGYVGQLVDPRFKTSGWVEDETTSDDVHVSQFAQEALGITDYQAMMLFSASNSAERIRQVAEKIAGEPL